MSAIKIFTFSYLLGGLVIALALLVIVLALFGVETVGQRLYLAYPIIGGGVLLMGSKYALAAALRKAETRNG